MYAGHVNMPITRYLNAISLNVLKRKLKTHLFNIAYAT